MTPLGALHEAADPPGDRIAVLDGTDGAVTYAALGERVGRAANALAAADVERGDRVALCFPNDPTYLVLLLGAARIGAVPVPVNVRARRETVAAILEDAAPAAVVAAPAVLDDVAPAAADAGLEAVLVDDPDPGERAGLDLRSLRASMAASATERSHADVAPDDPALQPYTSGSTGRPKGVVLTHGGIDWNVKAFVEHLSLSAADRSLAVTPLYHKNAMTGAVKPMLRTGGSAVILREFEVGAAVEAIDDHGVTYMTGVPAVYKRLVDADALDEADVSSLAFGSCGSATVPESLVGAFRAAFDAALLEVYGLTEGGPVVTHSPRDGERRIGSAGRPLPGVETLVVDPDTGEPCPTGETGELLVSNPGLGRYYRRPEATRAAFEERGGKRFLHTGDLAWRDDAGHLHVVGRLDDMLIVGGENVYPAAVEDLLSEHPAVEDVAVVGAPHAEKGEAPVAFVVAPGATEAELREFALERGPAYAHPRRVFFLDALPLTGTGKVDRERLSAEATDRIAGPL